MTLLPGKRVPPVLDLVGHLVEHLLHPQVLAGVVPVLLGGCLVVQVGGVVLAPPLHRHVLHPAPVHLLVSSPVYPGVPCDGHLPELGHGGRAQQCRMDWA